MYENNILPRRYSRTVASVNIRTNIAVTHSRKLVLPEFTTGPNTVRIYKIGATGSKALKIVRKKLDLNILNF